MKTRKIPDESHYPMGYLNGTDVAGRPAVELEVALEQIQDAGVEQLALFPGEWESAQKLQEVERYLVTRFGPTPHLRHSCCAGSARR